MIPILYPNLFITKPAGKAIRKYAIYTAESTKVDCVVVNVNDFFRWGISIGFRLFEKPHKKNKVVIRINANPVLETALVAAFFGNDAFISHIY